jgi:hypothetical protein
MTDYKTRFIPQSDAAKLVNYYHLARCALSGSGQVTRLDRMLWACRAYHKENPAVSTIGAYKDLECLLA